MAHDCGDFQVVVWGDWREGETHKWCSRREKGLTQAQRKKWEIRIATADAQREKDRLARAAEAEESAWGQWVRADGAPSAHPYTRKKGIAGLATEQWRVDGDERLLIALRNEVGALCNIQKIDAAGGKFFWGPVAGLAWWLGFDVPEGSPIVVCEGVATAATLRRMTGLPVRAAMNAGNLAAVCAWLKARHPTSRRILAADNDRFESDGSQRPPEKNVGVIKARAATAIGGLVVIPEFPAGSRGTDWNDLALEVGEAEAKLQWDMALAVAALDERLATLSLAEYGAKRDALIREYKAAGLTLGPAAMNARRKSVQAATPKQNEEKALLGAFEAAVQNTFYDIGRKEYLQPDDRGVWMPFSQQQIVSRLAVQGVQATDANPMLLAEWLTDLQNSHGVDYSGPVAGHPVGLIEESGRRILVTEAPRLIPPQEGTWQMLDGIISNALDTEYPQSTYFLGWLAVAVRALYAWRKQPGQALILIGPADCGKTLLQSIITVLLGGREARPYKYMTGQTGFNGNLAGAEHLRVADEVPHMDILSRRAFGSHIKQICVEPVHHIEAKYQNAISLRPFWRISISLNDEPENLRTLPTLDEHTLDKLIILRVVKAPMPMPTGSIDDRDAFWAALEAEFPSLIHFLLFTYTIPDELQSSRYGITHFHHPEITAEVKQHEAYMQLLSLLDTAFFPPNVTTLFVEDTAEGIERRLLDNADTASDARKLLSWRGATGRYLAQLAKECPERVERTKRHGEKRTWRVMRVEEVMADLFPPDQ